MIIYFQEQKVVLHRLYVKHICQINTCLWFKYYFVPTKLINVTHHYSILKLVVVLVFFLLVVPRSLQKKFRFWVHVFYNWQGLSCGIAIFHFSNYNSPHFFHLPLQFCLAFFFLLCLSSYLCLGMGSVCFF
jgi:hypothetical protein